MKVTPEDVKHVILKHNINIEHPSKWTDEQMKTVVDILQKFPQLALKAVRAKLSQIHNIDMSESALGKIRRAL